MGNAATAKKGDPENGKVSVGVCALCIETETVC